jgi:hypothetical protein
VLSPNFVYHRLHRHEVVKEEDSCLLTRSASFVCSCHVTHLQSEVALHSLAVAWLIMSRVATKFVTTLHVTLSNGKG